MKVISWSLVAVAGLGIMAWAYFGYVRLDETTVWSSGLIYLRNDLRGEARAPIEFRHVRRFPQPLIQ